MPAHQREPQSPAAGEVALPSPFVSPATVSSLSDVNVISESLVPFAMIVAPGDAWSVVAVSNFTTTPGSIVRTAGLATVTVLVTMYGEFASVQVVFVEIVPDT